MLLLDEPAAGLSRAERQLLTALLLSLDRDVTLLLIEHDMDVALTVAERVTMMHDGAVIVEGTPAEIRADQRVHDLYLGRAMSEQVLEIAGLDAYYGSAHVLQRLSASIGSAHDRASSGATAWASRRCARRSWASPRRGPAGRSAWTARRSSAGRPTTSAAGASPTCRRDGGSSRR